MLPMNARRSSTESPIDEWKRLIDGGHVHAVDSPFSARRVRERVLAEQALARLVHRDELDAEHVRRQLPQLRGRRQGQHLAGIRIE